MQTFHYYWIGAIPAMVFLGLVMMPFYYGSKVRSVPEFLAPALRPQDPAPADGLCFALASVLLAGVNLYAMAIVVNALLGWPTVARDHRGRPRRARLHLPRRPVGGHLQRGAAVLRDRRRDDPADLVGLHRVGGWNGLVAEARPRNADASAELHAWPGPRTDRHRQPRRLGDRRRARPRLRDLVRLLDDQLRRGAAGVLGEAARRPRSAPRSSRAIPEGPHRR